MPKCTFETVTNASPLIEQLRDARMDLRSAIRSAIQDVEGETVDEEWLADFLKLMESPITFDLVQRFCLQDIDMQGGEPSWWQDLSFALGRIETLEKQIIAQAFTDVASAQLPRKLL